MDKIESELTELYRKHNAMNVLLLLSPYEAEHLNNLISLGMRARRGSFQKQKRKWSEWEKHLCAMDRKLWKKVRETEKLALKEFEMSIIEGKK